MRKPSGTTRSSFTISLDEAPEARWAEVIRAYKPKILKILSASEELQTFVTLGPKAQFACSQLLRALPPEQRREVHGAANALGISAVDHCGRTSARLRARACHNCSLGLLPVGTTRNKGAKEARLRWR